MKRSEAVKTIVIYCAQNILLVLKSFQILHNMTVKVLHITCENPALKLQPKLMFLNMIINGLK